MGIRLLIADDNPVQIKSILAYVDWAKLGVTEIKTACDGEEAYVIAEEFKPNIVILDIEMPKMDGLELARILKESDPRVKMIFISCHEKFAYAQKAISYGGCAYILKPISYDEIYNVARDVIDEISREMSLSALNSDFLSRQEGFESSLGISFNHLEDKPDIFAMQQEILDFVEQTAEGNVSDYFEQKYFSHLHHKDFNYTKYICYSIVNALQLVIKSKGVDMVKLFGNDNIVWDKLATFEKYEDIVIWLKNFLSLMVEHVIELEGDKYEKLVERIKNRIDEDVYTIASVEQITRELNVSAGHCKNIFKRYTGITIFDYLFEKRMNEAKRLLEESDLHVYEIAEKLGYSSQTYFSTTFRKKFGMKPNDYRKGRRAE